MSLCDTYFSEIPGLDSVFRKFIVASNAHFYYFEPNDSCFGDKSEVVLQVNIKGSASSKFVYNSQKLQPNFAALLNIQSSSSKLEIASIFNQINPSSVSGVALKRGERLVVTIYKPSWANA